MQTTFRHGTKRGALIGLIVGLVTLTGLLAITIKCIPYRISFPPPPWPWYCTDPLYGWLGYLAFPVNILTKDLSQAVILAPLSLVIYAILGALIGSGLNRARHSTSGG
jgi:hypothetical protein